MTTALLMLGQLVMGKATRDALFLATFDVELLPRMMVAAAAVSFLSVLGVSRAMARYSPFRVMPVLFAGGAAVLLTIAIASARLQQLAAVLFYLHMAAFGPTVVAGFWSLVNERYDPRTARQVVSRFAGGATAGGIAGGAVAWQAAPHVTLNTLLLVLAATNLLCAFTILGLFPTGPRKRGHKRSARDPNPETTLRVLWDVPYLRHLGALVGLGAVASAVVDYLLSVHAVSTFHGGPDLLSFFARLQLAIGILSFLALTILSRPALKNLGLAGTVALLPGAVVIGGVGMLAWPGLWAAIGLRGAEATLRNSMYRSGYELLYTPIAPKQKRATKLIIDVGFDKVGTAVGSGLTALVVAFSLGNSKPILAGLVMALGAVGLFTARQLHRGYVRALEDSLRTGVVELDKREVVDATTWQTLTQTNLQLDRKEILAEIERLRKEKAEATGQGGTGGHARFVPDSSEQLGDQVDAIVAATAELRSGDPVRIRKLLDDPKQVDPTLVAHIIPLMTRKATVREAMEVLRELAPAVSGQLLDALLDGSSHYAVRRRMPRVLRACPTQRVADGLLLGLTDERFEVRYQCGLALASITEENSSIVLSKEAVLDAAMYEVEADHEMWDAAMSDDVLDSEEGSVVQGALSDRKNRSMEHVFTVLGLVLERDPLLLAYRALGGDDKRMRGTALEYLENVLPARIRGRLWDYVGDHRSVRPPARPTGEIVDDLLRSASSLRLENLPITPPEPGKSS